MISGHGRSHAEQKHLTLAIQEYGQLRSHLNPLIMIALCWMYAYPCALQQFIILTPGYPCNTVRTMCRHAFSAPPPDRHDQLVGPAMAKISLWSFRDLPSLAPEVTLNVDHTPVSSPSSESMIIEVYVDLPSRQRELGELGLNASGSQGRAKRQVWINSQILNNGTNKREREETLEG